MIQHLSIVIGDQVKLRRLAVKSSRIARELASKIGEDHGEKAS